MAEAISSEVIDKVRVQVPSVKESSKEEENVYVKLVDKKIRALSKKLNINIANIEKKVSAGAKINEDEQKVLANKVNILKSLKEFEDLKSQMKVQANQEEKPQKKSKRKGDSESKQEEKPQIQALIELFHVCDFLNKSHDGGKLRNALLAQRKTEGKSLVISESDIDGFFKVAQLIQSSVSGIDISSEHVVKLLGHSEEEVYPGKTYKHLRLQLTEVVSSPLFLPKESHSPTIETQEVVPQESPKVPENHTETSVPNHTEHTEEIIEETEPVETEEGEQQQSENPSDEGGKERRDQNKRSFRRRPVGRGRGRGNFSNQEGSPKEGNFNNWENRRGRGNRRGSRGSIRGGNTQKPIQQSATPS